MPAIGRRSKMHILFDILAAIEIKGGVAKPTHILYKANLSHPRLKEYLAILLERGFIEERDDHGKLRYALTDKGKQFVREFEKIEELSQAFGLEF